MNPVPHVGASERTVTDPLENTPATRRSSSHLALVLSGGGARASYQVGTLAGLAERLPGLDFPILTGVSAGAINTAYLAAGRQEFQARVSGLREQWSRLTGDRIYRVHPARLAAAGLHVAWQLAGRRAGRVTAHGLVDTQPLREFLTDAIDMRGIDLNIAAGRLRAVALSATSYTTGQSVTFAHGGDGAPTWARAQRVAVRTRLTIEHVMASAALPIIFPAVKLGDEFYGDGSVSHLAPLAPAIHLGAKAIVAIGPGPATPSIPRTREAEYPSPAEVVGLLFRAVFLDALESDAERLDRVNRTLTALPAGQRPPDGLRPVALLMLRPSRELGSFALGNDKLLPVPVRLVVRAMGGERAAASDFLGHLLFHPRHTSRLIDLGYEDVGAQWPTIEPFFERLDHVT